MVIFQFVMLVYQRVSFPEFIGSTIPGLPGAITGPLNWVVPKLLLCCLQVVSYKPTSTRKPATSNSWDDPRIVYIFHG